LLKAKVESIVSRRKPDKMRALWVTHNLEVRDV